jgi:hypothetical protein
LSKAFEKNAECVPNRGKCNVSLNRFGTFSLRLDPFPEQAGRGYFDKPALGWRKTPVQALSQAFSQTNKYCQIGMFEINALLHKKRFRWRWPKREITPPA